MEGASSTGSTANARVPATPATSAPITSAGRVQERRPRVEVEEMLPDSGAAPYPPAAAPISGTEVDITDVSIVLAGANKLDVVESRARREVSRGPRNKRARHVRKSPTPSISQTFNIDTLTSD